MEEGLRFCTVCGTALASTTTTSMTAMPGVDSPNTTAVPVAGYWWRALAYIVDFIIILVAVILLSDPVQHHRVEATLISVAINIAYWSLTLIYLKGQTLGMRLCGMRVVDAVTRSSITTNQALRRAVLYSVLLVPNYLRKPVAYVRYTHPTRAQQLRELHQGVHAFWLSLVYLSILILDLLWAAWDARRQTLHDKFASTVVVREG
jgi:uncharacterized RDD family membrane protein YckC